MTRMAQGEAGEAAGSLYDQILLFGDSITEFSDQPDRGFGFAIQLRADYMRRLDVVNRGLSGYNTDLALRVVQYVVPPPEQAKVRLMTLFFGANDCCFPVDDPGQNQCVPLPQFRANIIGLARHPAVLAQNPHIILFTPPPIDERQQGAIDLLKGFTVARRSAENTRKYAQVVLDVGRNELNVPVVDLWTKFMEHVGWTPDQPLPGSKDIAQDPRFLELFIDGLHLSPLGYRLMYDEFRRVVFEAWPEFAPERLPYVLPVWNQFPDDWSGPQKP